MNGETPKQQARSNDVDDAKHEVARAERALSRSLHDASAAGRATMERAVSLAKPLLVGVAVVAGIVWLVKRARRARKPVWLKQPSERSVLAEAARAATLSLASAGARKLAEHWLMAPEPAAAANAAQNDRPSSRPHFD